MLLQLKTENLNIVLDADYSYLNNNFASASGTITVDSITSFGINQILLIGQLGSEDAEIIKTHASSAPSGNTITLASNTTKAHNRGTKVSIIQYDKYELTHAATSTGTKTALTTSAGNGLIAIDPERTITLYNDPEYNSGSYFIRPVNSIGGTFTASGATLTSSAHGLVNGQTIKVIAATTLPAGLFNYVLYYVVGKTTNTFELSLTNGGTSITTTDAGTGTLTWYKSSNFSDALPFTGYTYNQVGYIKNTALSQLGESKGELLSDDFLNTSLWEARREVDNSIFRWSFRTSFNTDIGNVVEGAYSVAVPSTLRRPDSPDNILGLRIGGEGQNLSYVSKREFDRNYVDTPHTTVATQAIATDTSITLTSSRDFDESGSIRIGANTITYTANDQSTGILSGIPASGAGSIDTTQTAGLNVWQNASFGLPSEYTIFEDTIYFNCPFESTYVNRNIEMDYYRTLPEYDSDGDTLDEPETDFYVSYLKYKIKYLRSSGKITLTTDSDYVEYVTKRNSFIKKERSNQLVGFSPETPDMSDL